MEDSVIDTCCLMNVAVSGKLYEVVSHTGMVWHIPSAVAGETIFIRTKGVDDVLVRQELDLSSFFASGILSQCAPAEGAETSLYVELAADLADGEAMGLAIAKSRGWALATDDRKARRRAAEIEVLTIGTPEIVRRWADRAHPDMVWRNIVEFFPSRFLAHICVKPRK